MKRLCISLILSAALIGPAVAQVRIDERRPAAPRGEVGIENAFGSVRVIGWDKHEVAVTGTLAAGAEGLEIEADEDSVGVWIEVPDAWFRGGREHGEFASDIEVRVPLRSSVEVETVNGHVEIIDVAGYIGVESVNGDVTIRAGRSEIEVESMTGTVTIETQATEVEVESVSGDVIIRGASGEVAVATVSGNIEIEGQRLAEVDVECTSGNVTLHGSLAAEGSLEVEVHSGSVELTLPADVNASFECETFSGSIRNEFGPRPSKSDRFVPAERLRFSTGEADYDISIQTFSGNITLRKGGHSPISPHSR